MQAHCLVSVCFGRRTMRKETVLLKTDLNQWACAVSSWTIIRKQMEHMDTVKCSTAVCQNV